MDERVRNTAWAIAEAWWRKLDQIGAPMEGASSTDYADTYWETWLPEARAALDVQGAAEQPASSEKRERPPAHAIPAPDVVIVRRHVDA
jgi:hypothetical protein